MMKHTRDPLKEKSVEEKMLETIDGLLPEMIRMRNNLNSIIMEMDFYKTMHTESGETKIAKIVMLSATSHFGVSKSAVESKSRDTDTRMARQIFLSLTKELTSKSFARVGAMIGKDHATVMHAKKVTNNSNDPIHSHFLEVKIQVQQALLNVDVEKLKARQSPPG